MILVLLHENNLLQKEVMSLKPVSYTHLLGYSSGGYTDMPINHKVFLAQFDTIKKIADEGPCILVGRCADYALEEYDNVLSVFIHADMDARIRRIARIYDLTDAKAKDMIIKTDKKRSSYYNYYSNKRWGDVDSYDMCLNSSMPVSYTHLDVYKRQDKRYENLYLLPSAQTKDKSAISPGQMKKLTSELKEEFDYILLDCPAGIEQGFQNAVAGADRAIVVTTPEVSAIRDADRIIGLLEKSGLKNNDLLINRIRMDMVKRGDMMSVDDVTEILAIPLPVSYTHLEASSVEFQGGINR